MQRKDVGMKLSHYSQGLSFELFPPDFRVYACPALDPAFFKCVQHKQTQKLNPF